MVGLRSFLAAAYFLLAAVANAATIDGTLDIVYTGDLPVDNDGQIQATVGDRLSFEISLDLDVATLFGAFDTFFTSSTLAFVDWAPSGIGLAEFEVEPEVLNGLLFSAAFGDWDGVSEGLVATVEFEVIAAGAFSIQLWHCTNFGGCWLDASDFLTPLDVELGGVSGIATVPLPGAAWLFLSGLCVLCNRAR